MAFFTPYLSLFFYSDAVTGIMSSTFLLSLAVLLDGGTITVFFLYFLSGIITIAVFRTVTQEFKVQAQFIILLSSYILLHGIFSILPMKQLYVQDLLMIILNVFISTILLFFVFWIYSVTVVHKNLPKYMEMNDPEFIVMKDLKDHNKTEYYKLIHTAYLSEKLARELGANLGLIRGLSYYHQLGISRNRNMEKSTDEILQFAKKYTIPYELYQLLLEFHDKKKPYKSREAIIVTLSDQVVSSILYLFAKDKDSHVDYHQLVEVLFKKKMENGFFLESDLTIKNYIK
jgi:membrane-associated HD superfamily phosphohydrolase